MRLNGAEHPNLTIAYLRHQLYGHDRSLARALRVAGGGSCRHVHAADHRGVVPAADHLRFLRHPGRPDQCRPGDAFEPKAWPYDTPQRVGLPVLDPTTDNPPPAPLPDQLPSLFDLPADLPGSLIDVIA